MNQGIAHASGDLLWFMNSGDCFSDPDAVAHVAQAISGRGPAREVWGYGMDNIVGLGRQRGPIPFSMRKFLAGWEVVPHQASFFGASLVSKLGGYNLDLKINADQEFILRAAFLREPITTRRVLCDFDPAGAGSVRPPREAFKTCDGFGTCTAATRLAADGFACLPRLLGLLPTLYAIPVWTDSDVCGRPRISNHRPKCRFGRGDAPSRRRLQLMKSLPTRQQLE